MEQLSRLGVKIFADGADFEGILALYKNPLIHGFTTNPSLMRKAGVEDYEDFARRLLAVVPDRPISLEVFADEPREMVRQAEADAIGCHIITVTHDLLAKLGLIGKDLEQYSLETVETFHRDAKAAGYSIDVCQARRAAELARRAIS